MKRRVELQADQRARQAFTLMECMVALMVIAIGFLGMAGVMIRAMQVQTLRDHLDNSVKLARTKAGSLSQISYSLLATGGTTAEKELWGAAGEEVVRIGPVNKAGELNTGTEDPPFLYYISFVVCLDDTEGGDNAASQNGDPCEDTTITRPDELACNIGDTDANQAAIHVMTTFYDKNGRCHKVAFDQISINFE